MRFLLLILALLSLARAQDPEESRFYLDTPGLVALSDDNFEHETQAASGQTTGSWLVFFHTPRDETMIYGALPEEDFFAEHHIVLGAVNTKKGILSWERFQVKQLPSFVFIHKGKYYKFQKPPGGYTWSTLVRFVTQDVEYVEGTPVPLERHQLSFLWDVYEAMMKEVGGAYFRKLGYAFGVMIFLALGNKLVVEPMNKRQRQQAPQKKKQ